jgi:hypothetical protein
MGSEEDEKPHQTLHILDSNKLKVFKWDERSTFSQLAGLHINERMTEMLNLPQSKMEILPHREAAHAQPDPESPTNTTISNQPVIAFDTNSYIQTMSTANYGIDSEMTCSKIIDLLEPSVRESMKMRKFSMATQFIKPNTRKVNFYINVA